MAAGVAAAAGLLSDVLELPALSVLAAAGASLLPPSLLLLSPLAVLLLRLSVL